MQFEKDGFSGVLRNLKSQSPVIRIVGGVTSITMGTFATVAFWNLGFIWVGTLVFILGGLFLFVPGVVDYFQEKERLRERVEILNSEDEIVSMLVAARRQGRSPFRVLNEQQVRDAELRQYLLQEADRQIQRDGRAG